MFGSIISITERPAVSDIEALKSTEIYEIALKTDNLDTFLLIWEAKLVTFSILGQKELAEMMNKVSPIQFLVYVKDEQISAELNAKSEIITIPKNIEFGTFNGYSGLLFGDNQLLYSDPNCKGYSVLAIPDACQAKPLPCGLMQCNPKILKKGDFYFTSTNETPDFSKINSYRLFIDTDKSFTIGQHQNGLFCLANTPRNTYKVVRLK